MEEGGPPYTPLIAPKIAEPPWPVSANGGAAAVSRWRNNARQARRGNAPQNLPLQAWMWYQLRFLLTAELLGALATFVGMSASLNHISIVLNIATTDTSSLAFTYGRLVRMHLEEKARARAETTLGDGFFAEFSPTGNLDFKNQDVAEFAPRAPPPRGPAFPKEQPDVPKVSKRPPLQWPSRQNQPGAVAPPTSPPPG